MNRLMIETLAIAAIFTARPAESTFAKAIEGDVEPLPSLVKADEAMRQSGVPEDISGIAMCRKDGLYWAVCDSRGELCRLVVDIDSGDGKIRKCALAEICHVPGGRDMEGLAYDPLRDSLWVCDEKGPRMFEYLFREGRTGGEVELPEHLMKCIKNRALEAIEISPDGLSLWTCNEKAIPGDGLPREGRLAPVRLSRFVRKNASEPWRFSAQWFYYPDSPGANVRNSESRNGVAAVCVDSKERVVILERERNTANGLRFRMRIFEVVFPVAADAASPGSIPILGKRLLYEADTGMSMYEGMCLGPVLKDGAQTLVLVSDGDEKASESIMTLVFPKKGLANGGAAGM